MIKSQMPTLEVFIHQYYSSEVGEVFDGMVKFIKSKSSLERILITSIFTELKTLPFKFLRQIIAILNEPTSKRPFLNLFIYPLQFSFPELPMSDYVLI